MKRAILTGVVSALILIGVRGRAADHLHATRTATSGAFRHRFLPPNPSAPNIFVVNGALVVDQEPSGRRAT